MPPVVSTTEKNKAVTFSGEITRAVEEEVNHHSPYAPTQEAHHHVVAQDAQARRFVFFRSLATRWTGGAGPSWRKDTLYHTSQVQSSSRTTVMYFQHQQMERSEVVLPSCRGGDLLKTFEQTWNPNSVRLQFLTLLFFFSGGRLSQHSSLNVYKARRGPARPCSRLRDRTSGGFFF